MERKNHEHKPTIPVKKQKDNGKTQKQSNNEEVTEPLSHQEIIDNLNDTFPSFQILVE